MKGPAVWPNCTSFRIFLLIMEGLSLADRRLKYSLGVRGPWKPILNPRVRPVRRFVNVGTIRMIMQVRGKLRDTNRSGRGQL